MHSNADSSFELSTVSIFRFKHSLVASSVLCQLSTPRVIAHPSWNHDASVLSRRTWRVQRSCWRPSELRTSAVEKRCGMHPATLRSRRIFAECFVLAGAEIRPSSPPDDASGRKICESTPCTILRVDNHTLVVDTKNCDPLLRPDAANVTRSRTGAAFLVDKKRTAGSVQPKLSAMLKKNCTDGPSDRG